MISPQSHSEKLIRGGGPFGDLDTPAATEKFTLLIADDHVMLREALRNIFEQCSDIEVVAEASDGLEAVEMCTELQPDVILMDIMMPKLNGIEATKQIREVSPRTAVLMLTGYDDDCYVAGLLESGAAGYLLKSTERASLVSAVRAIAQGEAVLDSCVFAKILHHTNFPQKTERNVKLGDSLTMREMEVFKLVAHGMSNKEIATTLCVTVGTVKAHLSSIFSKMQVASRAEAVFRGITLGLVEGADFGKKE